MLYYFDINTCIVTTVSGVSNILMRRATLRLQLVNQIYRKIGVVLENHDEIYDVAHLSIIYL